MAPFSQLTDVGHIMPRFKVKYSCILTLSSVDGVKDFRQDFELKISVKFSCQDVKRDMLKV